MDFLNVDYASNAAFIKAPKNAQFGGFITQKMSEELKYKVIITTEEDLRDIEAKLKPILKIN